MGSLVVNTLLCQGQACGEDTGRLGVYACMGNLRPEKKIAGIFFHLQFTARNKFLVSFYLILLHFIYLFKSVSPHRFFLV